MGKEFQKSALPTLFHFVRVKASFQPQNSILKVYKGLDNHFIGGALVIFFAVIWLATFGSDVLLSSLQACFW